MKSPLRLALVFGTVLVAAGVIAHRVQRANVLEEHVQTGRAFAESVAIEIERGLESSREDVLFLASLEQARDAARSVEGQRALERIFVSFMHVRPSLLQARFLDTHGREVVRVDRKAQEIAAAEELQDKSARYYFAAANQLPRGSVHVSRLDLNIEHGKIEVPQLPVVRFSAAVFDEHDERIGVLVINRDARPLLEGFARWAEGAPGVLTLSDDQGMYLWHPNRALRFLPGRAPIDEDRSTPRAFVSGLEGKPRVRLLLDDARVRAASAEALLSLLRWLGLAALACAGIVFAIWKREQNKKERKVALGRARDVALADAAAALAHEVKNPLAAIINSVSLLKEERSATPADADSVKLMEIVIGESMRLGRTLDDFLGLARPQASQPRAVDLPALTKDVVALASRDPVFADRVFLEDAVEGAPPEVFVDPDQLRQVLWNLVLNAGAASRRVGGSRVRVVVSAGRLNDSAAAVVAIDDDGPGPPELGSDRGGPARGGLGLIVASGIIARHGGQLELRARPSELKGTRAVVTLPASRRAP